jgi:hypothetical protein
MNLQENILKVLNEGLGKTNKRDQEFADLHKTQVANDPEQDDPKAGDNAPKSKVPKGQGAKGVKITDVEEYDGKKVDPKKQDDVKTKKDTTPKGKGIKGFKEAYESGDLSEEKTVADYNELIKKHTAASKGGSPQQKQFHNDMIHKYRKARMNVGKTDGGAPPASGEDSAKVKARRLASIKKALSKESKLDPVNKKSAAKDFDNRKDKDIDNDGDVDSSDKYLHKRRKAISKATKEAVDPAKFVKGGNLKVKKNDVDSMLSKLFGNSKLSKEAEKNKAYKAGYKGGKNPYKKDTADFHLFILGQQAKSAE